MVEPVLQPDQACAFREACLAAVSLIQLHSRLQVFAMAENVTLLSCNGLDCGPGSVALVVLQQVIPDVWQGP